MEQKQIAIATLGGLLALSGVVALASHHVSGLDRNITNLIREARKPIQIMQTLTETVTTQSGRTIIVVTTRGEDETAADFAKRHDDAVQAAKKL